MSAHHIAFYTAEQVREKLNFATAINAIETALHNGLDPEADGPRLFAPAPGGEFLLMPAQNEQFCGLKALTIAPDNPARGLEKIQGLYILYSAADLAPIAVLEGACLTAIRTPAVTLTAVRHLARLAPAELPAQPRITICGAGTQARAHVLAALVDFPDAHFQLVGRNRANLAAAIGELQANPHLGRATISAATDTAEAITQADIIITATTSLTPVFDGSLVKDNAIVAACGTHGLDAREIDDALVTRADLVVEGRGSAARENGNLATALKAEDWRTKPPANLSDLVRGNFQRSPGRPAFYSGVGMSWEDLVCASAVVAV